MSPDIQQVKQSMKATWMAGDFGQIANYQAANAAAFVERLGLRPGMKVLDVACGTGNLAIPAAKLGCEVAGVDIAPNLLEQARERAAREEVRADFQEGDAEALPFGENTFDVVMSMYGAMFAPRPDVTARELVRVCKPSGLIAMANWTPAGFVGQVFKLNGRFVPAPEGVPAPALWGDPKIATERLRGAGASTVETVPVINRWEYPFGPAELVEFFKRYFGPTQVAMSKLDAAQRAQLTQELVAMYTQHNQGGPEQTIIEAEYLEVRARK